VTVGRLTEEAFRRYVRLHPVSGNVLLPFSVNNNKPRNGRGPQNGRLHPAGPNNFQLPPVSHYHHGITQNCGRFHFDFFIAGGKMTITNFD
jgi:hypothetical protein